MIKKLLIGFIFIVLSVSTVFAQENLSPIESIPEWRPTEEVTTSESTEVTQPTQEEQTMESSSESEMESEIINFDGSPTNLPKVTNAQELLNMIDENRSNLSSNYYLINLNMGQMTLVGKALVSSPEGYYLTFQNPPFLPMTVLVIGQDGVIEKQYIPLEALIAYASDAMNQHQQIYAGTIVEEFYVFAQENYDNLKNKFIEIDDNLFQTSPMFQEAQSIDTYWLEVLKEFFASNSQDFSFEKGNGVETLVVQGDLAQKFTEIALSKQAEYPELKNVFELFENGLEGTLSFNYDTYEIGIGLLSFISDSMTNGIEYYIQPVQPDIKQPEPESIISLAAFNDQFGKDFFEEINSLNQSLSPEQFESGE